MCIYIHVSAITMTDINSSKKHFKINKIYSFKEINTLSDHDKLHT